MPLNDGLLQRTLDDTFEALPRRILKPWLVSKFAAAGLSPPETIVDDLVAKLLEGRSRDWDWPDGPEDVTLTVTSEDIKELDRKVVEFTARLPAMIGNLTEEMAGIMLRSMVKRWPAERPLQRSEMEAFRRNLEQRWGGGLTHLRMLLMAARDVGERHHRRLTRSRSKRDRNLKYVLSRLQARGCQITDEIICLLENGFADGAMARWRTLHEVTVVATVIADQGDTLAERYLAHEAVEAKRALDQYATVYERLGYKAVGAAEQKAIQTAHAAGIARYGVSFGAEYGWAAEALGLSKPRFSDLEEAAGRAALRSHYKMASYSVHAGVKGINFQLGALEGSSVVLTGVSNAGLDEPGKAAPQALTMLTFLILAPPRTFDDVVYMRVLQMIADRAEKAFAAAGRRLEREEAGLRKPRTPQGRSRVSRSESRRRS